MFVSEGSFGIEFLTEEDKLRSTSMENGVSGCRVRRACRNDNEDNALGERASGRTSSGAHRGEPIAWGGESTASTA